MGGGSIHFSVKEYEALLARRNASRRLPPPVFAAPSPKRARTGQKRHREDSSAPNGTETRFNAEVLHGAGIYEGVTFRLPAAPGVRRPVYTPDFAVWDASGRLHVYEVKGSYRLPSEGRAATAFDVASGIFPAVEFNWASLAKDGRSWKWKVGGPPVEARGGAESAGKRDLTGKANGRRTCQDGDVRNG